MNSKSLHIKVKLCNSCKRELPDYFFGILRSAKDGFNPKCKECRCTQKRLKNCPELENEIEIYHLKTHNRAFLKALHYQPFQKEVMALSLKDFKTWNLSIKMDSSENTVIINGTKEKVHLSSEQSEVLTELILINLELLQLRLFHCGDYISLSNWGFSSNA